MTDALEKYWAPATRFTIPESWWVVSELLRRNPSLILIEMHQGGGMYDCLSLLTLHGFSGPMIHLNRVGSIVAIGEGSSEVLRVTWGEVFANEDSHRVVKQIEQAFPHKPPKSTPPTNRRTVGPRVVSALLSATVHDRHRWDARNAFHDTAGYGGGVTTMLTDHGVTADPASAIRLLDTADGAALLAQTPEYAYWGLIHQDKCVAVVCPDGTVRLRGKQPLDIYQHYRQHNSIAATAAAVLAHISA